MIVAVIASVVKTADNQVVSG